MNELQQKLIQKALQELKTAEHVLRIDNFNAAASRTYYALFYAVQALLIENNLMANSHGGIISLFANHYIKTGIFPKDMGKTLSKIFEKRQISDYDFEFMMTREEAELMLVEGEKFADKIIAYMNGKAV